jgi:hypothetical protein
MSTREEQLHVISELVQDVVKAALRKSESASAVRRAFPDGVEFLVVAYDATRELGAHAVAASTPDLQTMRIMVSIAIGVAQEHATEADGGDGN